MALHACWPLAVLLLAGADPALAQGLGDAAARERDRRQEKKEKTEKSNPPPTFTNQDLTEREGEAPGPDKGVEKAEGEAKPVPTADPGLEALEREREERALAEREWRARFAEARAKAREAEARCWQDVIRTEFYQGIPVQMRVKEFVESEEFRAAKKALADLEEELRRTGLPPGWGRE